MHDNGLLALAFGSYFGMIFHAYQWPSLHTRSLAREMIWKPILRLVVAGLLCLPFVSLFLVKKDLIGNEYILMIVNGFIPAFASGFILFGVADRVNMYLNLLKFSDFTEPLIDHIEVGSIQKTGEAESLL